LDSDKPSDLRSHLGYWLRIVSNAVSRSFADKVAGAGVTVAEWVFLRELHDAGAIAPSDLAVRMGMTRGGISKLADRLVKRALVERRADPADGRAQTLCLAPAGQALVPRLAAMADGNDAEFFAALDGDERQQLERLLRRIVADRGLTGPPVD
jgi:DNA-binding MarR family transcriptional regulator